jgi:hypothetical protein
VTAAVVELFPSSVEPGAASPTGFYLTKAGAEQLTAEIRRDLGNGIRKLVQAREGRAWEVLGYPTWHDYCVDRFGDLRDLALPSVERAHLVASMKASRMPNRPIAAALGVSAGTVAGDVARLRAAGWQGEPDTVDASDGSSRPSRSRVMTLPPDYTGLSRMTETAARVAAQGDRGLTSVELDHETGWAMGTATGNLSKLERRGWVVRSETFRRNRAAYTITGLGSAEVVHRMSR